MPTYPALMELFSNFPRTAQASAPGIISLSRRNQAAVIMAAFYSQE
ncbi:hypothetical protein SNSL317_A0911 [Salmonella enterica subsp. enterica serovar Newport str. SL317]|nr:hypothetical protein SNSL317_A0911 [Salmonella enterica subsp. enterica serovar Newport str. SL317]